MSFSPIRGTWPWRRRPTSASSRLTRPSPGRSPGPTSSSPACSGSPTATWLRRPLESAGQFKEIVDRTVWRQDIHAEVAARKAVNTSKGIEGYAALPGPGTPTSSATGRWNTGRHAAATSSRLPRHGRPGSDPRHQSGDLRKIEANLLLNHVSWRSDESAVLCIGDRAPIAIVDPRTLEVPT